MGEAYSLDTSAVSNYLRGKLSLESLEYLDGVLLVPAKLSVIARIELEVFNPPTKGERDIFLAFVREATVYELSEPVILQTVKLRRHYKGLKPTRRTVPDAIIAATAIVHDFMLLSTNNTDFELITDLKYISLTN